MLYFMMPCFLFCVGFLLPLTGVKVDVQSAIELVGTAAGQPGGQVLAEQWHSALEDSVAAHFPGNALINCMCHNTSVSGACWAAYDMLWHAAVPNARI